MVNYVPAHILPCGIYMTWKGSMERYINVRNQKGQILCWTILIYYSQMEIFTVLQRHVSISSKHLLKPFPTCFLSPFHIPPSVYYIASRIHFPFILPMQHSLLTGIVFAQSEYLRWSTFQKSSSLLLRRRSKNVCVVTKVITVIIKNNCVCAYVYIYICLLSRFGKELSIDTSL